jgi:ubiquinone/menaquinone biosynthesis C-methylase UbiE
MSARETYDAMRAASYWSVARHELGDELSSVLSQGAPRAVNEAYDAWETGLVLQAIEGRPLRRGLDLGIGTGRVALELWHRISHLVGGDLAPGMLDRARRNALGAGARHLDLVRLRSDRLPYRDASFDLVVCLGLLEHIPPGVRAATLHECARVLGPGGFLLVALNNESSGLLRDPRDNPYRDGVQHESGYYCAVVGERALLEETREEFTDRILGSNLFYSLHRHASLRLSERERGSERLRPFFERAAAWDVALRPQGPLAESAADHHLHLLVRR